MQWDPTLYWVMKKGVSVRLSEHFSSHEFDCKCTFNECTVTVIKKSLPILLEDIRWHLYKYEKKTVPILINCGNRCVRHNRAPHIKGANDSRHLPIHGDAADLGGIISPQHTSIIEAIIGKRGGFHAYDWGVHIDDRGYKARW